eukprot:s11_g25.t2
MKRPAAAMSSSMESFIKGVPKVELHLHLEGTLEPELLMKLAAKNKVDIKYSTVEEVRKAYKFTSLDSFLELYYQGMSVLVDESDFFELAWAYLVKVNSQNVRHVEVFFDPQPHMQRNVPFETFIQGFTKALKKAETDFGLTSKLIMCFVRHLPVEDMEKALEASLPYKHLIVGVGLDSTEKGNHPEKYKELFEEARGHGYECVAHAGEEGPPEYITAAMDLLKVKRVDHGVRCAEDPELVERLIKEKMPLTVCPLSNVLLCVFKTMKEHNLKKLLDQGVCITLNSDDPAYFTGYMTENFLAVAEALPISREDVIKLVQNSIDATLLDDAGKSRLSKELEEFSKANP